MGINRLKRKSHGDCQITRLPLHKYGEGVGDLVITLQFLPTGLLGPGLLPGAERSSHLGQLGQILE